MLRTLLKIHIKIPSPLMNVLNVHKNSMTVLLSKISAKKAIQKDDAKKTLMQTTMSSPAPSTFFRTISMTAIARLRWPTGARLSRERSSLLSARPSRTTF